MDEELKSILSGLKEGQEKTHSKIEGMSSRLDEFKQEMNEFKNEMYGFKGEMHEFRNETNHQLDRLDQKDESINGTEALNQRVWNLEKQFTNGSQKRRV